jgi:predicted nucleic acid-binding protein
VATNQREYLILDTCALLNLIATGVIQEILSVIAQNSIICVLVQSESRHLRKEDDISEKESVDLEPLISTKVIQVCNLETPDEQQLFVSLAVDLDDGEAMSVAIALSRNWYLATDDKPARRIFIENNPNGGRPISTSDLIKEWAESENVDDLRLKPILLKVERKASFHPPKSDSNLQWWNKIISM